MIILQHATKGYQCGGKAKNLFILRSLSIRVPEFVVIPAEVAQDIVANALHPEEAIRSFVFPTGFTNQLMQMLPPTAYYSVRSSAADEDGGQHSFAGQFETCLYVQPSQLETCIRQVWQSAYSERVRSYRQSHGLDQKQDMAVIVQVMVNATVSGVAFGIHPVSGDRSQKLISSVYGVGEGLVSGELNADTYLIKRDGMIEEKVVEKEWQFVRDTAAQSGVLKVPVKPEFKKASSIRKESLLELKKLLDLLYVHFGKYQDVEFAFCEQELFVLQTRPITTVNTLPDNGSEFIIWDNSNIIESYPGVTSPLTFSFILPVYEAVYKQFAALMGVSQKDINANKQVFANMLGLLNGRVYYNLLSWYKALALLPGYSMNAGFMEKMMGVKERFELKEVKPRHKFVERVRVLNMVRILLNNLRALPSMRKNFVIEFNAKVDAFSKLDFNTSDAWELMRLYEDFEQTLLKKWKAPLVNDFFAMVYFGLLQKLVLRFELDEHGTIQNDLLCGADDIISTQPMHLCMQLSTSILQNEALKHLFLTTSASTLTTQYQAGNFPPLVQQQIDGYLRKFGNRCVGELKLETITYSQNPESFLRIIKSYVEQGMVLNPTKEVKPDKQMRAQAEAKVKHRLKGKPFKTLLFNYVLSRARTMVSARENLRYERTRAFGVVRELFCAMGKIFQAEGLLEESRDIFYLTKEEVFHHIKGTSVNGDLKKLVTLRKKEFQQHEQFLTRERIQTHGLVYSGNDFFSAPQNQFVNADLKGLGCCPGVVQAKVRVIHDPSEVENLNGDILVTSSTDPGWVTLFPTASGILVERGSLLSHSAIVSREMGKPCIVGITGLLQQLKSGDEVQMNGSTGEVKIINKQV